MWDLLLQFDNYLNNNKNWSIVWLLSSILWVTFSKDCLNHFLTSKGQKVEILWNSVHEMLFFNLTNGVQWKFINGDWGILIIHFICVSLFKILQHFTYFKTTKHIRNKRKHGNTYWLVIWMSPVQYSLRCVWAENSSGRGEATENTLPPQVQCLVLSGEGRRFASEEWRLQEGVWWLGRA